MVSILEGLGIVGWVDIENQILAALVTGDPVLLVGTHGEGKTYGVKSIFGAFNKKIKVYDASKSAFEDILGFPVPTVVLNQQKALTAIASQQRQPTLWMGMNETDGDMVYLKTALSIDDSTEAVFIDELSRAKPATQSRWLEVIRSRTIMGMQTKVKWVFAAMNPLSYSGTNFLDAALLGRFAYFLPVPETVDLDYKDAKAVALIDSADDAIALRDAVGAKAFIEKKGDDGKRRQQAADELRRIVSAAQELFFEEAEKWAEPVADYVTTLSKTLSSDDIKIDGRRRSMIRRNVIACSAVLRARGEELDVQAFTDLVWKVLRLSLPHLASGEPLDLTKLRVAHQAAAGMLQNGDRFLYDLNSLRKPADIAIALVKHLSDIPQDWQARLIERMLSEIEKKREYVTDNENRLEAAGVVLALAKPLAEGKIPFTAENRLRVLRVYESLVKSTSCNFRIEAIDDADAMIEIDRLIEESETDPVLRVLLSAAGSEILCTARGSYGYAYGNRGREFLQKLDAIKAATVKVLSEVG